MNAAGVPTTGRRTSGARRWSRDADAAGLPRDRRADRRATARSRRRPDGLIGRRPVGGGDVGLYRVTQSARRQRSAETDLGRKRRARRMARVLAETHPDAHCELDYTNAAASSPSPPSCPRRPPTSGSTRSRRSSSRATRPPPTTPAADRAELEEHAQADRLLPEQDRLADQAGPGAGRAVRRRGARQAGRPGRRCPASGARRPTSSSATRSASRASPSTPTSSGWCSRWRLDRRDRPGEDRARGRRR